MPVAGRQLVRTCMCARLPSPDHAQRDLPPDEPERKEQGERRVAERQETRGC